MEKTQIQIKESLEKMQKQFPNITRDQAIRALSDAKTCNLLGLK